MNVNVLYKFKISSFLIKMLSGGVKAKLYIPG